MTPEPVFHAGARVHIIGVGGAGMSGVARLLVEKGCVVSGSDRASAEVLDELATEGVRTFHVHDAQNVNGAGVVLYSPAVAHDHVELLEARREGVRVLSRSELLGELAKSQRVIGLTGTHGKTTATSMMVHVMHAAQRDDSRLLGAAVRGVGANGHFGVDDLILEVDESYGSFRDVTPFALGVLNVEADHLDHYHSLERLENAFGELIGRTEGPVAVFNEPGALRSASMASREVIVVGPQSDAHWRIDDIQLARRRAAFTLATPRGDVSISLGLSGMHNVANAATVAALALALGIEPAHVEKGLSSFRGVPRRFDHLGTWRGAAIYEDYAHLPSEIRATVAAAKVEGYERIGVVFQPHRVTRTTMLAGEFAHVFDGVSTLIVSDIYPAGEDNPEGVTGEIIVDAVRATSPSFPIHYATTLDDVAHTLASLEGGFDIVIFMGAGDIAQATRLLEGGVTS